MITSTNNIKSTCTTHMRNVAKEGQAEATVVQSMSLSMQAIPTIAEDIQIVAESDVTDVQFPQQIQLQLQLLFLAH